MHAQEYGEGGFDLAFTEDTPTRKVTLSTTVVFPGEGLFVFSTSGWTYLLFASVSQTLQKWVELGNPWVGSSLWAG